MRWRPPTITTRDGQEVVSTAFTRMIAQEESKQRKRDRNNWDTKKKGKSKRSHDRDAVRVATLKKMPYRSYLETPHWKSVRRRTLARNGGVCNVCGSSEDLNIHHLTYKRIGREKDSDLQVLCRGFHCNEHEGEIAGVFDPMTKAFINLVKSF